MEADFSVVGTAERTRDSEKTAIAAKVVNNQVNQGRMAA